MINDCLALQRTGTVSVRYCRHLQVLFAIISKCVQLPSKAPLRNFLRSKDEAVSVPFILWVAAMEAKATGQQKQVSLDQTKLQLAHNV